MRYRRSKRIDTHVPGRKLAQDFRNLSHRILDYANRGIPKIDFLREVSKMLINFSGCDTVELRVKEGDKCNRCEVTRRRKRSFRFVTVPCTENDDGNFTNDSQYDSGIERLCRDIVRGHFDPSLPFFTRNGSFWTHDVDKLQGFRPEVGGKLHVRALNVGEDYGSLALIPLGVGKENTGLLQLKSRNRYYFTQNEIEFYEGVAQTLGIALAHQRAQAALRERIKELTCLYGIAQLVERPNISLKEILQGIVELLPPAWQYPDITSARIILDGVSYFTPSFREARYKQTAAIVVNGERRGAVEVAYTKKKPELDEGPFLKEERSLIYTVARQVALIIEQRHAEEDKAKLQDQLRHADRLATIGQLAAGVAHELNEPLGNILGFAQLAKKCPELPGPALKDVERIVTASLYAREVIKKLMLFARQMPPQKTRVNLNQTVEEGLSFFESRCAKEGIELVRLLSSNLPEITADPAQLNQVMVNLVVNAIQAMPDGGRLMVRTIASEDRVSLIVEDTGVGMSKEVVKQIFLPFYTTKDVGQGTGLGLAVVHGIVTSHKGSINVESKVGIGTKFEIQLPLTGPE